MTDAADDILGKADAFMKRRRPLPPTDGPAITDPQDDDIPLLTDIVPLDEAELLPPPVAPIAAVDAPSVEERIAAEVARQLAEHLAGQEARQAQQLAEREAEQQAQWQQALNQTLDQWLARELPDMVAGELEGLADCLVVRIEQALRQRLSSLASLTNKPAEH